MIKKIISAIVSTSYANHGGAGTIAGGLKSKGTIEGGLKTAKSAPIKKAKTQARTQKQG